MNPAMVVKLYHPYNQSPRNIRLSHQWITTFLARRNYFVETCESEISVQIEPRIKSAATIRIWIESQIESADSRLQLQ